MRKNLFFIMLLSFFSLAALAQSKITGKVTSSDDGAGIPGVTVQVKGTSKGTQTDVQGNYSIDAAPNQVLVYSFVGMKSQEIRVGTQRTIDVILRTSDSFLDEVVVTGTGAEVSKKRTAFAVESLSGEKLPTVPTGDVGTALVGKIAGAQISSTNGSPGSPVNILLRGINSIRGGTSPMILVDGVQVSSTGLESLDLNSYERIEVVQGPAAASIYGAQGANGVIQLFSKKGQQGKVSINISSNMAVNSLLNVGNVNKARNHAFATNANGEVIASNGEVITFDETTGSYLTNPVFNLISPTSATNKPYGKNLQWYDHYKMFFQPANTYNNTINLSTATDKYDVNMTLTNNDQATVFKNNGHYNRTNFSLNAGLQLAKGLRFRTSTQLINTLSTLLDPTGRNMFYAINNSRPFANYEQRDALGLHSPYFGDAVGVNGYNFNYITENASVADRTVDIIQAFNLNYKPFKFLEIDSKYGINRTSYNSKYQIAEQSRSEGAAFWEYWAEFYSPRASYGSPTSSAESGEINNRDVVDLFTNFNTQATFRFNFADDFNINIPLSSTTLVGWDYRKRNQTDYISYGLNAPSFTPYNATNMATFQIPRDYREDFATYGYLVNQRFEYGNLAGLSVGFRSDYSSAFGRGSKPFTFPRGDFYYNIGALNAYKNTGISKFLTDIKLRAAYGEAGIQPGAYDRFPILNTATIGSQSGLKVPIANANPDLQVEVSKEFEAGTDLRFKVSNSSNWLNNVGLSFTYWKRRSENIIDQVDVAPSLGIGRQLTNSMTLGSNGIQASLITNPYQSRDFVWNFVTNFARQTSRVEAINGGAEIIKTSAAGSSQYVIKAGEKIGQLYGYLFLNDLQAKDEKGNLYIPADQQGQWEIASNGYVVNKTTKQPFATAGRYAMGDPNPMFNMSFINDFIIKRFITLGVQFDWIYKSNLYNQTKQWMYRDGIHRDYDNPITINGQTDAWSAFYRGAYAVRQANGTKSYFLEDASFVRLRNLQMGFDLSQLTNIKYVNKLQLVLAGRNLWTATKYTGMDPEVSSGTTNSSWDRGVDHNTIPNLKSYQIGLNVGF